jgi:hypothetical protein
MKRDVHVELCVKKLTREYGYNEEEARKGLRGRPLEYKDITIFSNILGGEK